jgi:hypothetical protein
MNGLNLSSHMVSGFTLIELRSRLLDRTWSGL